MNRAAALILVRDLMFRSKIEAAAANIGVEVFYSADISRARELCETLKPKVIIADLSDTSFSLVDVVQMVREAAPLATLTGFASHVELKTLKAARDAGFGKVLSRSEFTAQLPALLAAARD
jgi:DNA-binding NarL/FixJ family response regulator